MADRGHERISRGVEYHKKGLDAKASSEATRAIQRRSRRSWRKGVRKQDVW